jgi:Tfp pilus assembly protein PilN
VSSAAPSTAKGKGQGQKGKKPFWQMEVGRKGSKGADVSDEAVDHPPFSAVLPRVNLLPPAVRQAVAMRRVRHWLTAIVAVLVVVVAGVWYVQGSRIDEAEARLAAARATGAELQAQVDAFGSIKAFYSELESQKLLVNSTLASQPQAAVVVERLVRAGEEAGGSPISFSSVGVSYHGIPEAGSTLNPCPNPDPFGTEITVGCLSFSALAKNRAEVSRLLEVLEQDPLFVGPYVTSTSIGSGELEQETGVTFAGTAGISLDGLSTALTQEQIDAITNPAPEPDEEEDQ